MSPQATVLLVDDEIRSLEALQRTLEDDFTLFTASSADEALAILESEFIQVIVTDQRMPDMTGVALLRRVRERHPQVVRIILSGYTDNADIIAAVNEAGIYQYLLKPWHPESLLLTVQGAAELFRLQQDNELLNVELKTSAPWLQGRVDGKRRELKARNAMANITRAAGSPLDKVCELLERVAGFDIAVLIEGESGVGKELLARALHYASHRRDRPFVVENCAAMPEQLLESELFGHKRGAFTGAYQDHIGLFQQADGGTIFLDEIGETSPAFQAKLLRVLQEGEIRPVGSPRPLKVDVRVVSATNRKLAELVREGRFREDLYYRLSAFAVTVPPLRERPADIPLIAEKLLDDARRHYQRPGLTLLADAQDALRLYRWPGNVRQLRNELNRMLVLADGDALGAELLSPEVLQAAAEEQVAELAFLAGIEGDLKTRLEALEKRILKETLTRQRWNKTRAAEELGLSRVGLRSKLTRYGLE
ncbi:MULTISPECIES: sigma-54 dependent transcriptional regulator [Vogesella]|uniref:Sigma-54 dependent transcriptional regulator n=1 Tax=Vogesella aquatica TaxID=2984206 RepID=A0ABT5IVB4_9NEIS|nr:MULTISPECIES: sigma-54 dependent transcriptional regulator [Vogesella]MDC7716469.1 sigma-54 dependent transcriptional regulator [Vogesella aquatica]UDM18379.1 sigma-54 dependent transcriptional regulator [Vogesella sp. XCS3]